MTSFADFAIVTPAAGDYIAGHLAAGGAGSDRRYTRASLANPPTDDGMALGSLTGPLRWSDLYLASGAVIDWGSGNVVETHSAATLTFTGLTTLTLGAACAVTGGSFKAASPSGGVGYSTGAGNTVTQLSSKSTTVAFNALCGAITLNGATLNAQTVVSFTFTNTSIAATDVLIFNHISGGTIGAYFMNAQAAAGSATVNIRNMTAANLTESPVIQFAVIKAVNS